MEDASGLRCVGGCVNAEVQFDGGVRKHERYDLGAARVRERDMLHVTETPTQYREPGAM